MTRRWLNKNRVPSIQDDRINISSQRVDFEILNLPAKDKELLRLIKVRMKMESLVFLYYEYFRAEV